MAFKQFSIVKLIEAVTRPGEATVLAGREGTVTEVFQMGKGVRMYRVQFSRPLGGPVTFLYYEDELEAVMPPPKEKAVAKKV